MRPNAIVQLATPDWLLVEYVEHGRTMTSLAAELGCTKAAISRALRRHDIPSRHPPTGRRGNGHLPRPLDEDTIRRRLGNGESLTSVAASLNISRTTLTARLDLGGRGHRPVRYETLEDVDWLRIQYEGLHRPLASIAVEVGCSTRAVRRALERAGIPVRQHGQRALAQLDAGDLQRRFASGETIRSLAAGLGVSESTLRHRLNRLDVRVARRKRVDARLDDRDWLHQRYVTDQRSMQQIADELGCGETAVWRAVHRHNLPRPRPGRPPARPRLGRNA